MFIVWFRDVGVKYRFKYYHLNITQGVLDKNRSQNCKERDTQAVRQGMKKEEEEEEEKEEEEKKVRKKFGSFSVLLFGAITK